MRAWCCFIVDCLLLVIIMSIDEWTFGDKVCVICRVEVDRKYDEYTEVHRGVSTLIRV
jgi:hypothetical protein